MSHDEICLKNIKTNPNLSVPWFLMTSWLYYWKDESVVSDDTFSVICRTLEDNWEEINHWHKGIIGREGSAQITSGSHIPEKDYPARTTSAAMALLRLK